VKVLEEMDVVRCLGSFDRTRTKATAVKERERERGRGNVAQLSGVHKKRAVDDTSEKDNQKVIKEVVNAKTAVSLSI
jgi:hypothetical protein